MHRYRTPVLWLFVGLLCLAGLVMTRAELREDVEALLPRNKTFRTQYALLEHAPLSRGILIDIEAPTAAAAVRLPEIAAKVARNLHSPQISDVISGPPTELGPEFIQWLTEAVPITFTEDDRKILEAALAPDAVAERLREVRRALYSPGSLLTGKMLLRDPLAMRDLVLRKISGTALVSDLHVEGGQFLDTSGRHAMIIAKTPVPITDSGQAAPLLEHISAALAAGVPAGFRARYVCGHRYSLANATVIKRDLRVVFAVSAAGLILCFLMLVRRWQAILVFLIPFAAALLAAAVTAAIFPLLCAVTIGFGAVLLGISVDYGLHVIFALDEAAGEGVAPVLNRLAPPLLISALTTIGALTVLLNSDLPAQKQLAVFTVAGLICALAIAVLVLPHWLRQASSVRPKAQPTAPQVQSKGLVILWALFLVTCAALVPRVRFDGELRNLGYTPQGILDDEQALSSVWGDPRGQTMVFARGNDYEAALSNNDRVHAVLTRAGIRGIAGIAPLLPSRKQQADNIARWQAFWSAERKRTTQELLTRQGVKLGFQPAAFQPMFEGLQETPRVMEPERAFRAASLLFDHFRMEVDGRPVLMTLVPNSQEARRVLSKEIFRTERDIITVSQSGFAAQLGGMLTRDFKQFFLSAGILVVVTIVVLLRNPQRIVLCLLPVLSGLLAMFGIMGLLEMPINLFNVAACVLVLGLGVDYGVFMSGEQSQAAKKAVLVSGLTTICGFGALVFARHPAMHAIGVTVALGIVPTLFCALAVVPRLKKPGLVREPNK